MPHNTIDVPLKVPPPRLYELIAKSSRVLFFRQRGKREPGERARERSVQRDEVREASVDRDARRRVSVRGRGPVEERREGVHGVRP